MCIGTRTTNKFQFLESRVVGYYTANKGCAKNRVIFIVERVQRNFAAKYLTRLPSGGFQRSLFIRQRFIDLAIRRIKSVGFGKAKLY